MRSNWHKRDLVLTCYDKKLLSTVRGFVSLAIKGDSEKAGTEIEAHLAAGGNFDEIMKEIEKAVQSSGFFSRSRRETDAGDWNGQEQGKDHGRIKAESFLKN